jgi:hypothetical protein
MFMEGVEEIAFIENRIDEMWIVTEIGGQATVAHLQQRANALLDRVDVLMLEAFIAMIMSCRLPGVIVYRT